MLCQISQLTVGQHTNANCCGGVRGEHLTMHTLFSQLCPNVKASFSKYYNVETLIKSVADRHRLPYRWHHDPSRLCVASIELHTSSTAARDLASVTWLQQWHHLAVLDNGCAQTKQNTALQLFCGECDLMCYIYKTTRLYLVRFFFEWA